MNWLNICWGWLAVGILSLTLNSPLHAQPGGLVERIRNARENFRPLSPEELATRRQAVLQAAQDLNLLLARSQAGYAAGWKAYLEWDFLEAGLAEENPDLQPLRTVLDRLGRNHRGLEMTKFRTLRERLADFVNGAAALRERKLGDDYLAALDDLAKRIEEYEQTPSGLNGPEIARTLAWLNTTGQGEDLVAAVQARYQYPNIRAHSSERFLSTGFNQYVDRTTPVRDNILGTQIQGMARFTGTQVLDMVPSSGDGRLNILLRGTILSNNLGFNGPVTLRSTGTTSVVATKQLVVNENGLFAVAASAHCRTSSSIHSLWAKCGIVERIAWRKAGKQKGAAEAIASNHAEARINSSVDSEAVGLVAQANAAFQEKYRQPLLRRGYPTRNIHVSTTNHSVQLSALQMARAQLAAPSLPPRAAPATDLAVQAHESAVANFSEAIIGGFELTDEGLVEMLREAKLEVPEELEITDEKEPWSITFSENHPLAATFSGNLVTLYLRANRFTRGRNEDGTVDQDIRELVQISATYTIEKQGNGALLKRQGEVNVDFVESKRLNTAQITTKTFLRRKFDSLFKEELAGEGLRPKGRFARAGLLALQEIQADQGWITLGWQMQ